MANKSTNNYFAALGNAGTIVPKNDSGGIATPKEKQELYDKALLDAGQANGGLNELGEQHLTALENGGGTGIINNYYDTPPAAIEQIPTSTVKSTAELVNPISPKAYALTPTQQIATGQNEWSAFAEREDEDVPDWSAYASEKKGDSWQDQTEQDIENQAAATRQSFYDEVKTKREEEAEKQKEKANFTANELLPKNAQRDRPLVPGTSEYTPIEPGVGYKVQQPEKSEDWLAASRYIKDPYAGYTDGRQTVVNDFDAETYAQLYFPTVTNETQQAYLDYFNQEGIEELDDPVQRLLNTVNTGEGWATDILPDYLGAGGVDDGSNNNFSISSNMMTGSQYKVYNDFAGGLSDEEIDAAGGDNAIFLKTKESNEHGYAPYVDGEASIARMMAEGTFADFDRAASAVEKLPQTINDEVNGGGKVKINNVWYNNVDLEDAWKNYNNKVSELIESDSDLLYDTSHAGDASYTNFGPSNFGVLQKDGTFVSKWEMTPTQKMAYDYEPLQYNYDVEPTDPNWQQAQPVEGYDSEIILQFSDGSVETFDDLADLHERFYDLRENQDRFVPAMEMPNGRYIPYNDAVDWYLDTKQNNEKFEYDNGFLNLGLNDRYDMSVFQDDGVHLENVLPEVVNAAANSVTLFGRKVPYVTSLARGANQALGANARSFDEETGTYQGSNTSIDDDLIDQLVAAGYDRNYLKQYMTDNKEQGLNNLIKGAFTALSPLQENLIGVGTGFGGSLVNKILPNKVTKILESDHPISAPLNLGKTMLEEAAEEGIAAPFESIQTDGANGFYAPTIDDSYFDTNGNLIYLPDDGIDARVGRMAQDLPENLLLGGLVGGFYGMPGTVAKGINDASTRKLNNGRVTYNDEESILRQYMDDIDIPLYMKKEVEDVQE